MSWRQLSSILTLVLVFGLVGLGCGSGGSSTVTISISTPTASVITNTTQTFAALVSGSSNTNVTWTLTCPTGVTAPACGTINSTTGVYTAPAVLPTVTTNGTTTVSPTATITATAQADTTKFAIATVTIITGISITITPTFATVGTNETFSNFVATVNNPGCNITSNPTCLNVTWSLPTGVTTDGTIDPKTGVYTAPSTAPSPNSITVTATSAADTSVTASALVTVVTSTPPTVTGVSPKVMGLGGLFQDAYITGTNFISTNRVFVNGSQLSSSLVEDISSNLIRIRIPDYILASPPTTGFLVVSVAQQQATTSVNCTTVTDCEISVQSVRPGLVGTLPDTIPQGASGVAPFKIDGGFFGTSTNPAVSASFNGQLRAIQLPASGAINSTRQMDMIIGGNSNSTDFSIPGLYPVSVQNSTDATKFAVANIAVQPNSSIGSSITQIGPPLTVGSMPSDVAINPSTGMAVVANTGSNSVSLIDLTGSAPSVVATLCTSAVGVVPTGTPAACPSSGPSSVSVDYVRNIALVVNSAAKTIAVVDLANKLISFVTSAFIDTPGAVGINPVTGRALVAMQSKSYGILMDLTQPPPSYVVGPVTISTGNNTKVAVEPNLNWAIATPGGQGSLGIVDLNRQSVNKITNLSRTTNVVTVTVETTTTTSTPPPLTVQINDTVSIQKAFLNGTEDQSFEGFYTVTGLGPGIGQFTYTQTGSPLPDVAAAPSSGSVNYSEPVSAVGLTPSVQGIGINTETQQAVLLDPSSNGVVTFFSLPDQSSSTLTLKANGSLQPGTSSAAFNPLTNTIVAVNPIYNVLSVIDSTTPVRLNDSSPYTSNLNVPVAVAIDPGTNTAVVVNQQAGNVVILSLGPIQPFSIVETSPKAFIANATLQSAAQPSAIPVTVIGKGFSTNSRVRLDGINLSTAFISDRQLTASVPPSLLSRARRFTLDVQNASGATTNAEDFTVELSIDMRGAGACANPPYPAGVAIDPVLNLAAVTLEGCNSLALIDIANDPLYGTGTTVQVGTNPIGVGIIPRLSLAVVANNGSNNASVVDETKTTSNSPVLTVPTGQGSMGVAIDQATGEAAVTNSLGNTVTILNATSGATSSLSTGQNPVAVAFNDQDHQVAVATPGNNSIGIGIVGGGTLSASFTLNLPTSVVYDPVPSDCTVSNTVGCFIASSSQNNLVEIVDPSTSSIAGSFSIGINPTAIAYNYLTSTLVSTNTRSNTVTVADILAKRIRAVLTLPPAQLGTNVQLVSGLPQFALDIHPLTNLAVIADTANGRVLFIPIPR